MNRNFLRPFILLSILITAAPLPVFAGSFAEAQHSMQQPKSLGKFFGKANGPQAVFSKSYAEPRAQKMQIGLTQQADAEKKPLLAKRKPTTNTSAPAIQKLPPITDVRDYYPKGILGIVADYVGEEEWHPVRVLDHNGAAPRKVHAAWFNQPDEKTITTLSSRCTDSAIIADYYHRIIWDAQTGLKINSFVEQGIRDDYLYSTGYESNSTTNAMAEVLRANIAPAVLNGARLSNNKQQLIISTKNGTAVIWKKLSVLQEYLRKHDMPKATLNLTPPVMDEHEKKARRCWYGATGCCVASCLPCHMTAMCIDLCCTDAFDRYQKAWGKVGRKLCYTTQQAELSAEESVRQAEHAEQEEYRSQLEKWKLELKEQVDVLQDLAHWINTANSAANPATRAAAQELFMQYSQFNALLMDRIIKLQNSTVPLTAHDIQELEGPTNHLKNKTSFKQAMQIITTITTNVTLPQSGLPLEEVKKAELSD